MLRREHRTRRHGLRSVGGWLPACAGWLAALSFLTVSCINEYPGEEPSEVSVGSGLALRVSLLDAEGYGDGEGDDLLPPVECMHDLRVIITHKEEIEGVEYEVIEYNRHIDFDDPDYAGKYRYGYLDNANLLFKVREGTPMKKHLYLFSNSEPVLKKVCEAAGLSKHPDPEEGVYGGNHYVDVRQDDVNGYLAALRDATFTQEELDGFVRPGDDGKVNGIPMSAEYDVEVEPGNTGVSGLCVIGDLHLVRACNKITFTFTNEKPTTAVFVQTMQLDKVASSTYLLPRVGNNGNLFDGYDGDWIKWLARHSHNDNGDDVQTLTVFQTPGQIMDGDGQITDYATDTYKMGPLADDEGTYSWYFYPMTVPYDPQIDKAATAEKQRLLGNDGSSGFYPGGLYLASLARGGTDRLYIHPETEPIYFTESNYHPVSEGVTSSSQDYKLNIRLQNLDDSNNSGLLILSDNKDVRLPNVHSLFRNTHVKINASIGNSMIFIKATLEPWAQTETSGTLIEGTGE